VLSLVYSYDRKWRLDYDNLLLLLKNDIGMLGFYQVYVIKNCDSGHVKPHGNFLFLSGSRVGLGKFVQNRLGFNKVPPSLVTCCAALFCRRTPVLGPDATVAGIEVH